MLDSLEVFLIKDSKPHLGGSVASDCCSLGISWMQQQIRPPTYYWRDGVCITAPESSGPRQTPQRACRVQCPVLGGPRKVGIETEMKDGEWETKKERKRRAG